MELLATLCLVTLGLVTSHPLTARPEVGGRCGPEFLAKYNMTVETFWSRDVFTKQYPLFRPNAQWSKMVGRSHDPDYVMWRYGEPVAAGVKLFAERGISDGLDQQSQGTLGILDAFTTKPLPDGVGSTSTHLLLDENHSKVSTIMRIVPSPDWFIGVDSLDLCRHGNWVEHESVALGPLDAGTDKGFTFTAPNWPEIPARPVTAITNLQPNHPANSFYYPDWDNLPALGRLTFTKVELEDAGVAESGEGSKEETEEVLVEMAEKQKEEVEEEVFQADQGQANHLQEKNPILAAQTPFLRTRVQYEPRKGNAMTPAITTPASTTTTTTTTTTTSDRPTKGRRRGRRRKNRKGRKNRKSAKRVDCEVGDWTEWGPCSKTCGYGNRIRVRHALVEPQEGGRPCPPLQEEELCGSMRSCGWNHFSAPSWQVKKE